MPMTYRNLVSAHAAHEAEGGYLLKIGDSPMAYAVCDDTDAIHCWGRTPEGLQALAPTYSEGHVVEITYAFRAWDTGNPEGGHDTQVTYDLSHDDALDLVEKVPPGESWSIRVGDSITGELLREGSAT